MKRLSFLAVMLGLSVWACGPQASKPFGQGEDTGGSTATGGVPGGGGGQATGGSAPATGGSAAGGMTNTGGTSTTGGHAATGGTATGGAASGGTSSGGSGGRATGGATGGLATGGATGGLATGGATGGVATGGVATGGLATGGVATGGVATGGVATGGTGTGGSANTCANLASDYQTAVSNAKSCTSSGTCGYQVYKNICGCSGCPDTTWVSDTTGPEKVTAQWKANGCVCAKTLCVRCSEEPASATCSVLILTAAAPIGGGGTILLPRTCQDQAGGPILTQ